MLVLKTTSPSTSPRVPKAWPVKTVPSSSASFAVSIVSTGAARPPLQNLGAYSRPHDLIRSGAHASSQLRGGGQGRFIFGAGLAVPVEASLAEAEGVGLALPGGRRLEGLPSGSPFADDPGRIRSGGTTGSSRVLKLRASPAGSDGART